MTVALWILALLFCVHLVLVIVIAELLVHPPMLRRVYEADGMAQQVAAAHEVKPELVQIRSADGTNLAAWWLPQDRLRGQAAVMVCHGVVDTAFGVMGHALLFLRNGYSVLIPDSRGHGRSKGFVTYGIRESIDIVAWQTWLRQKGVTEFFGFGESLGGSSLIQSVVAGAAFKAIAAECPYSTLERVVWDRTFRVMRAVLPQGLARMGATVWAAEMLLYLRVRYRVNLRHACPATSVKHFDFPVLLIHGTGDYETPIHHSEEIAAANPQHVQLWPVPEAKHTGAYATDAAEFERRVLELFESKGSREVQTVAGAGIP